ncbi:pyridoxal phosphate-dependent aminotransferase [Hydrogenimonas sp. SS33]|uniref:pyridoxal phosphate-dependent aminotransferase n=1 Tax=Hydrogenimonas leucolamina TaxID=2954236 RepID=UPI00336BBF39
MLSKRIQSLSESLTIAITSLAQQLQREGKDVIGFSAGEPDFDTPRVIKDAAIDAIEKGYTKYTAVDGIPELKEAIVAKLKRDNGLEYTTDQVIASNGAKQSLFNLFQATIDPGDEVIIPAPYWVTYPELVKYSEGVPVAIDTDDSTAFKITPEMLEKAITPKTRMLILTTPSNPTGAVYSKAEIEALAEVLRGTDILVASDEMYEKLVYHGTEFTATASVSDDMFQRTVTINGLSKSVAMTGWRFGYCASADRELVKAMKKLQSQSTSNINTITQHAAIKGLDGSADADIATMRAAFEERCDEAVRLFNAIDGLSVVPPRGAFYLFVNHKAVESDSIVFAKRMLEEVGIAVVPGAGFGTDGYFRFSFAKDLETIRRGIGRIAEFVEKYR